MICKFKKIKTYSDVDDEEVDDDDDTDDDTVQ